MRCGVSKPRPTRKGWWSVLDEIGLLCRRLAGDGPESARVSEQARSLGGGRSRQLTFVVMACRELAAPARPEPGDDLSSTVAAELAAACRRLSNEHREVLALHELLGLERAELAAALELDPAAVAPLLGQARIALRGELRGSLVPLGACVEYERTLRTATARQDGLSVRAEDEDWLFEHLGHCEECARAHAAMLEGATAYRGWPA
jgi:hypothetical protein